MLDADPNKWFTPSSLLKKLSISTCLLQQCETLLELPARQQSGDKKRMYATSKKYQVLGVASLEYLRNDWILNSMCLVKCYKTWSDWSVSTPMAACDVLDGKKPIEDLCSTDSGTSYTSSTSGLSEKRLLPESEFDPRQTNLNFFHDFANIESVISGRGTICNVGRRIPLKETYNIGVEMASTAAKIHSLTLTHLSPTHALSPFDVSNRLRIGVGPSY